MCYTDYGYTYMFHWSTDIPMHGLPHVILLIVLIVTWILGISLLPMHVRFLYSCHMDPRSDYMYYCAMLLYSGYMIVFCYWYGYSRYWTWELLICNMWNPTSIVPVSRYIVPVILFPFPVILFYAINRAQVQLSCYPYHVLYLFLLHCILDISDQ